MKILLLAFWIESGMVEYIEYAKFLHESYSVGKSYFILWNYIKVLKIFDSIQTIEIEDKV